MPGDATHQLNGEDKPIDRITDNKMALDHLCAFVERNTKKAGFERAVLGLSGGVDSSLSCAITAAALGPRNVLACLMPYKSSHPDSVRHAEMLTDQLGVERVLHDISASVDAYFDRFPGADRNRRGNKMARERMSVLYDQSAAFEGLVIGTSNRTEIMLGYGTLHGDTACAINPLGGLYKTHVFELARAAGVPEEIVSKPPTADLWNGQTDEGELGFAYRDVDRLLFHMIEKGEPDSVLVEFGFGRTFIEKVRGMVARFDFKRRPPLTAELPPELFEG